MEFIFEEKIEEFEKFLILMFNHSNLLIGSLDKNETTNINC